MAEDIAQKVTHGLAVFQKMAKIQPDTRPSPCVEVSRTVLDKATGTTILYLKNITPCTNFEALCKCISDAVFPNSIRLADSLQNEHEHLLFVTDPSKVTTEEAHESAVASAWPTHNTLSAACQYCSWCMGITVVVIFLLVGTAWVFTFFQ